MTWTSHDLLLVIPLGILLAALLFLGISILLDIRDHRRLERMKREAAKPICPHGVLMMEECPLCTRRIREEKS